MESENAATAKISEETVEAVDLPCLSKTMSKLIKRVIGCQERITQDRFRRKGASNLHRDFSHGSVFILQLFCHEYFCHKTSL